MNKFIKNFILISFIFFTFIICNTANVFSQNSKISDKLKIGVLIPLTGPLAEYGVAVQNGFELAKKELPEINDKFEFIYEDTQYDGAKTLNAFKKLQTRKDISLFYCWGAGPSNVLAPVAEQYKAPTVIITLEKGVAKNRKHLIQPFLYYSDRANEILLEHTRKLNLKKFAILKTELVFTNTLYDNLKTKLKNGESIEVTESFNPDEKDFRPSLLKLKDKSIDAVGVFLIPGQISLFYKQVKELGLKFATFGTDAFDSKNEIIDSGELIEGAFFPTVLVKEEFSKIYKETFKNDSQLPFAAEANSFITMLNTVIAKNELKKYTSEEILKAIHSAKPQDTAVGRYEFKETPELGAGFDYPTMLKVVKDGEIMDLQ